MSRILDGVSTDEVVPLSDPELGAARIGVEVEAGAIRLSYDAVEGFDSLIFPPTPDRPPGLPDRWPFSPGVRRPGRSFQTPNTSSLGPRTRGPTLCTTWLPKD
jgi:hypothetical protein